MHLKLTAPIAAALLLSACANTKPATLAADDPRNEGIAKVCNPTNPDTSKPGPYNGTIAMSGDGWCGVSAVAPGGRPFSLGLLRSRPAHGRVFTQAVANATRVEYTPDAGFSGTDSFTVALRPASGEDVPLAVTVNVAPGERPAAAAPAAAPAARQAAPSTGRRATTTRRPSSTSR